MSLKFPISRRHAPSWHHHVARYVFAMPYCYRKKVMDAGCQMGFGGHLLSYVANSVTMADISIKGLNLSKGLHNFLCPVNFFNIDFEKDFPADTEGWDTIVSFEVIEHLENPEVFIENVSKHLNAGGRFVFSVPHMVANREHKHLYDEQKIKDLISKYLDIEEFYVQDKNYLTNKPLYKGLVCYVGIAKKR